MLNVKLILLSISPFWKWSCIIIISIGISYVYNLIIENANKPVTQTKKTNFKKHQLNVAKSMFIRIVINWCKENIEHSKHHKYYPTIEIKYYKTKKLMGDYSPANRLIRIFINNHETIEDLVNTLIHEYIHYLQMPRLQEQLEYAKFNQTKGYQNNPYEIDAEEKACIYTPKCINYLIKLNYISKL